MYFLLPGILSQNGEFTVEGIIELAEDLKLIEAIDAAHYRLLFGKEFSEHNATDYNSDYLRPATELSRFQACDAINRQNLQIALDYPPYQQLSQPNFTILPIRSLDEIKSIIPIKANLPTHDLAHPILKLRHIPTPGVITQAIGNTHDLSGYIAATKQLIEVVEEVVGVSETAIQLPELQQLNSQVHHVRPGVDRSNTISLTGSCRIIKPATEAKASWSMTGQNFGISQMAHSPNLEATTAIAHDSLLLAQDLSGDLAIGIKNKTSPATKDLSGYTPVTAISTPRLFD